jgi:capsular polysaccharide biosynthesis protein
MGNNIPVAEKNIPFFKILYRNILLIVLTTVLFALCGLCYSLITVKPVYTVSRSYILRTAVAKEDLPNTSNATNNATLGKIYIPMVEAIVTSPDVISKANEAYMDAEDPISAGAVNITYRDNSLIFEMAYSDKSETVASQKLNYLYEIVKVELPDNMKAEDVTLIPTSKNYTLTVTSNFVDNILIAAVIGLVVSVAVALIMYVLDNTVKDRSEYESLTGLSVIAYIDKHEDK